MLPATNCPDLYDGAEARTTYDRAVARMEESAPNWPVLIELRDEAAQSLDARP